MIGNGQNPIVTNRYRSITIRFQSLLIGTDPVSLDIGSCNVYHPIRGGPRIGSLSDWYASPVPGGIPHYDDPWVSMSFAIAF